MRLAWPCRLALSVLSVTGCSDAGLRHARNGLEEIGDFHVKLAAATFAAAAVADGVHTSRLEAVQERAVYVVSPDQRRELDTKAKIRYFIDGYYANDSRGVFPFDVVVKNFVVSAEETITVKWSVVITTMENERLYACFSAEKDRLRTALGARGYVYPEGVDIVIDIIRGDGTIAQRSGKIRW
jgi:hypothetical protein